MQHESISNRRESCKGPKDESAACVPSILTRTRRHCQWTVNCGDIAWHRRMSRCVYPRNVERWRGGVTETENCGCCTGSFFKNSVASQAARTPHTHQTSGYTSLVRSHTASIVANPDGARRGLSHTFTGELCSLRVSAYQRSQYWLAVPFPRRRRCQPVLGSLIG